MFFLIGHDISYFMIIWMGSWSAEHCISMSACDRRVLVPGSITEKTAALVSQERLHLPLDSKPTLVEKPLWILVLSYRLSMHLNVYGCNFAAHVCFMAEVYFRVSVLPLCWTCGLDHSMLKYFLWNNFYEVIRNIYWVTDWDPKTLVSWNTMIIICSNIWPLALDLDTESLNPLKCPVWQECLLFQWGDCWWASGWRLVSERPTRCLVTKSCPTPCDPMGCSTPVFPLFHYLPELAQTHVHWVSDAIQPSHPLSSPSLLALNLSQHQGLF